MSLNSTPRTWAAGEKVTAAELNAEVRDAFTGIQAVWDTYTPAWTAATTNPAIGNGTLVGRYLRVGHTVDFNVEITAGSTTTFGSGIYSFSLPVPAYYNGASDPILCIARGPGNVFWFATYGSSTTLLLRDTTGAAISSSTRAWASGNVISIAGRYETA